MRRASRLSVQALGALQNSPRGALGVVRDRRSAFRTPILCWHVACNFGAQVDLTPRGDTARSPAMQPPQASSKPYVVVVGIDYSETGELALERAFEIARDRINCQPHVVQVANTYGPALRVDLGLETFALSLDEAVKHLHEYVRDRLDRFALAHGTPMFERVCAHQRAGVPAEEIAQLASDLRGGLGGRGNARAARSRSICCSAPSPRASCGWRRARCWWCVPRRPPSKSRRSSPPVRAASKPAKRRKVKSSGARITAGATSDSTRTTTSTGAPRRRTCRSSSAWALAKVA